MFIKTCITRVLIVDLHSDALLLGHPAVCTYVQNKINLVCFPKVQSSVNIATSM